MLHRDAVLAVCFALVVSTSVDSGSRAESSSTSGRVEHVGTAVCQSCHPRETELWSGSHHDLAMQPADESTVLGDFAEATLKHHGSTSRFFKRDDRFFVNTQDASGKLADFEIKYTFGIHPLQQYLVEFPDGRYQALTLAWDARPTEEGGQRWFHLQSEEELQNDDPLHWSGPYYNWNHMCGECHSTNYNKGYRAKEERFETTWSEIDVACEACHGPGSRHVHWAREAASASPGSESGKRSAEADPGLEVRFEPRRSVQWGTDAKTGLPGRKPRQPPSHWSPEVEACGRCHSRRSSLTPSYEHGRPLLDTHRLVPLEEGFYFPDGQIQEEVYVYGSYVQSAMYAAGVACSDCHDPHSAKLRAEGNALCGRCHEPARFDRAEHHHHPPASAGAQCVSCHMPERTYMLVDPRRDHSLRVPRPDLAAATGSPDACTSCHLGRLPQWAAKTLEDWGVDLDQRPHWARAIHAGRSSGLNAGPQLAQVVQTSSFPAIARATALALLPRYAVPENMPLFVDSLSDPHPLVRTAALMATEGLDPATRLALAGPLLADPVRTVRFEAARVVATVPSEQLGPERSAQLESVLSDFRAAQSMDADRAEAHMRLALLHSSEGQSQEAEAALLRAIELEPSFIAAYVNLADLYRAQQKDAKGEPILRSALERAPGNADVQHALGLLLVRTDRLAEAIVAFEQAAASAPEVPRYSYVLAVALHTSGDVEKAKSVLREASARHPANREIRAFLSQLNGPPRPRLPAPGPQRAR